VHVHDIADNREAQPDAAVLTGHPTGALAEPVEDKRHELRIDADAGITDYQFDLLVDPPACDVDSSPATGKLHGVRQQVPHHLLQPAGVGRHDVAWRVGMGMELQAFAIGRRTQGIDSCRDDLAER
jgi:hypothetical protein